MLTGLIKRFNNERGFGFMVQDNGEKEIFCHISEIEGNYKGMIIADNTRFSYEVAQSDKGLKAVNVRILDENATAGGQEDYGMAA
jgi:CspA family cold shock protein